MPAGGEVRRAAAAQPVHPPVGGQLERPEHGDLPVLAPGWDLRAAQAQRPAGLPMGSRCRWVSSSTQTTDRRGSSMSRARSGHRVVMGEIAAGGQSGPPPDRYQPDSPVQGAHWLVASAPPGPPALGPIGQPTFPSSMNRLIQRRTVSGWQSSSVALCAAGKPCSGCWPEPRTSCTAGQPPVESAGRGVGSDRTAEPEHFVAQVQGSSRSARKDFHRWLRRLWYGD